MPAVQPAPADMQRRHSSASSDAGSDSGQPTRYTSQENVSVIPTRTAKVATSKPVANPLQFVKVGPCDLSRYAQEQLKKAEEVKKVKPEKRDEAEDWQSNLDNWKFSRRKRQEHIIERVVEVKKLELEEHDRNRRRSKTFSEMLEERNTKGRKMSLPVYQDDDNDLSDLGISTSKLNGDDVFHDGKDSSSNKEDDSSSCSSGMNGEARTTVNGHLEGGNHEQTPEQEEYTYERAIQNYVNFTESRVRGKSLTHSEPESSKLSNGISKKTSPPVPAKPRRGSCKIEEKLSELEQIKQKSMSTNDLTENTRKPLSVPKVDILKRREMFEKSQEEEPSSVKHRLSSDLGTSKSIRDRVSSFGKSTDDLQNSKKVNRLSAEISVKDRLLHIEKQNSIESSPKKSNTSLNDNVAISNTVKDRLSTLQKTSAVESKTSRASIKPINETFVVKAPKTNSVIENISLPKPEGNDNISNGCTLSRIEESSNTKKEELVNTESDVREKSVQSPTEDIYETKRQQHYRHRSLDSLDVDSTDGVGNDSFERVQSLEDLDFCRNYPASSVSGDTDREDSGIHTADVSSSVSQADDCDSEYQQQPTILEEINKNSKLTSTLIAKQIIQMNVSDSELEIPVEVVPGSEEVGEHSCGFLKLPLRLDCDPLPVILESPSEPFPPTITTDLPNTTNICEPKQSSQNPSPSQSNVTNSPQNDTYSFDTNEIVNNVVSPVNDGDGIQPADNALLVNTIPLSLSTLPVNISPAEVVHDGKTGAVEICHKVDVSELATPLPKPLVSVTAEYKFEPEEGPSQKTFLVLKVKILNLKTPMELKNSFRE